MMRKCSAKFLINTGRLVSMVLSGNDMLSLTLASVVRLHRNLRRRRKRSVMKRMKMRSNGTAIATKSDVLS